MKLLCKLKKNKKILGGGGSGWGGQGGCEWRSEAFVKNQKKIKKKIWGGGGGGVGAWVRGGVGLGGVRVDGNREVRGPIRGWDGGGWGSKVFGRWVMWGMGDVNQE